MRTSDVLGAIVDMGRTEGIGAFGGRCDIANAGDRAGVGRAGIALVYDRIAKV